MNPKPDEKFEESPQAKQIKELVEFCEKLSERYRIITFQCLIKQQDRPMYSSNEEK